MGPRILILGRLGDDLRRELAALGGGAEILDLAEGRDPAAAIRELSPDLAVVAGPASPPSILAPAGREPLERRVEHEYLRSVRYRHPLAFALLSVDGLAGLEETFGPDAARMFADSAAEAVQRALREVDVMFRAGPAEFGVILPETEPAGARAVAERLRSVVARLLVKPDRPDPQRPALPLKATASVGLACCPQRSIRSGADVVGAARRAMDAARAGGGNRVATAE